MEITLKSQKGTHDAQGKREDLPGPKGKREDLQRPKGKRESARAGFLARISLGNQTARTHARTTRNDFPVGLTPPTSDFEPPGKYLQTSLENRLSLGRPRRPTDSGFLGLKYRNVPGGPE